jgi:hypothetical protein
LKKANKPFKREVRECLFQAEEAEWFKAEYKSMSVLWRR